MTAIDEQVRVTRQLIEEHRATARRLAGELAILRRQQTIPCGKCEAVHEIGDLVFVQIEYYKEPYSCTGGDYYYDSDENEFICPSCGTHNMLRFEGNWKLPYEERRKFENCLEKQFKREYKGLFKEVQNVTDKSRRGYWGGIEYSWIHNDYVEENAEAFGLEVAYRDQNLVGK